MSDYNKFKEIYDEIDELIGKRVDSSTPEFQAWKVKTERFLIKKYGEKSYELNNFRGYPFSLTLYTFDTTKAQFIEACAEDLKAVKAIFANYLEDMQEDMAKYKNIENTLNNTLIMAQTAADDVKNLAKQQAEAILNEAQANAKQAVAELEQDIVMKQKELEELQKQFDVYKAKMESLLISQLELLKDVNKD